MSKKDEHLSVEDYMKVRDKRAKTRMRLVFPTWVKVLMAIPAAYILFLIIYFLSHLRFLPEH